MEGQNLEYINNLCCQSTEEVYQRVSHHFHSWVFLMAKVKMPSKIRMMMVTERYQNQGSFLIVTTR